MWAREKTVHVVNAHVCIYGAHVSLNELLVALRKSLCDWISNKVRVQLHNENLQTLLQGINHLGF
jgi:hypothetical protein